MSDISLVVLYSKKNCGYCIKAKNLLEKLGLDYIEKKFEDFKSIDELNKDIGRSVKSMPQIKINGELIGGYNQLVEFLTEKKLVNFKGEILNSNNV